MRALGDKPALSELRKLGESTAARYPGYVDMGMSPLQPVRQGLTAWDDEVRVLDLHTDYVHTTAAAAHEVQPRLLYHCGSVTCPTESWPGPGSDWVKLVKPEAGAELGIAATATRLLFLEPGFRRCYAARQSAYMPMDEAAARESCAPAKAGSADTMTVLVTGTGGFIGAATALKLKEQGHGESHVSAGQLFPARFSHDTDVKPTAERATASNSPDAQTMGYATGVLGLDNFCDYYPVALKRARQVLTPRHSRSPADICEMELPGRPFHCISPVAARHVVH